MHYSLLAMLLLALTVTGCAKKEESPAMAPAAESADAESLAESPGRYLAYEHFIHIDAREDKIDAMHEAALAACRQAVAEQCVVLESQLASGRRVSARLKFRARAAGIQKIKQALSADGEVIRQSTTAEDLAGPIADSAKQLEMLRDYRTRLEALRNRASSDIDSLIKVNKELAEVQGRIEALSGEQAQLTQRVETQLLNVYIEPADKLSFWQPVAQAFADFGGNLSEAIAGAITALAYLIPWGLTLFGFGWAGRKLWRRFRQPAASA